MLRLLVANHNIEENKNICNLFSNNNVITTIPVYSGIETLSTYKQKEPDISVIDTEFADISYLKIISDLSLIKTEIIKRDFILTAGENTDINPIMNFKKVYQIFRKPFEYTELAETIYELTPKGEIAEITDLDIMLILLDLKFNIKSDGTKYMKMAIIMYYYSYPNFPTLKEIYEDISTKTGKTPLEVKAGIRNSLNLVNKARAYITKKTILDIYDKNYNITPTEFLDTVVTYLYYKKIKSNVSLIEHITFFIYSSVLSLYSCII